MSQYSDSLDNLLYTANNSKPKTTYKATAAAAGESSSSNYENAVKNGVNNSNTASGVTQSKKQSDYGSSGNTSVPKSNVGQTNSYSNSGNALDTSSTTVAPNPAATTPVAEDDDTKTNTTSNDSYYQQILQSLMDSNNAYKEYIASLEAKNAEALEAQKAAIQAGVDQSVNTLTNQKSTVNQNYADTLRQLYIDKMNAQKNIGQQMAAAGQTGGQAESTLLGLNTSYAENLRQGEQAKTSALQELETAIANAKLSGSAEEANAIANNTQQGVSNYLTAMNNLIGNGTSLASLTNSAYNSDRTYAQSEKATAYEKAMTLLSNGVMPDETTLTSAGLSTTEAQSLLNAINAQKVASSSGSSSSKKYSSSDKELLLNAYLNGDTSVKDALEEAYGYPISTILAGNTTGKTYTDEEKQILLNAYSNGDTSVASELEKAYGMPLSTLLSAYGLNSGTTATPLANGTLSVADEAEMIYKQSGKEKALKYLQEMYTNQGLSVGQYRTLRDKYSKLS